MPISKVSRIRNGKPSKNGNGAGCITHLKGNLRKPYRATVTTGWRYDTKKERAVQIRKNIGYFASRTDAQIALANYIQNPYDIDASRVTFAEIYEKWCSRHFTKISHGNIDGYKSAYKLCSDIQDITFTDLRLSHLQGVIDNCGKNYPMLRKIKILFNALFNYAMKNDVCSKNYAAFVDIQQYKDRNPGKHNRAVFSKKEIAQLWEAVDSNEYLQIPLILIYTGLRVGELRDLKPENIHFSERYFEVTKSKTTAGIRLVPIAAKIAPFFEHWLAKGQKYVFTDRSGNQLSDHNFRYTYWGKSMEILNFKHDPYDTRHTCISLLTAKGIDERIIQKIVGHAGKNVTQSVYTHLEIGTLLDAIDKI